MFNPTILFQMKSLKDRFEKNHPKFPRFLQVVASQCIEPGAVIEISVTKANGETIASNLKLNEEDMDLIQAIKNMTLQS